MTNPLSQDEIAAIRERNKQGGNYTSDTARLLDEVERMRNACAAAEDLISYCAPTMNHGATPAVLRELRDIVFTANPKPGETNDDG